MTVLSLVESVRLALLEEMQADPTVIVLGEDVGVHGGVFRATEGLQKQFGDDRVIDTPLAELGIAGVAIGAAMNGLRPVAEIQFADYIHPAFDQIVNEAAKIRYRSNGAFGVRSSSERRSAPACTAACTTRRASRRCSSTSPA